MDLPRQPQPVKITITGDHGDDIYRAHLCIKRVLENHYANIDSRIVNGEYVINCYPFAVND